MCMYNQTELGHTIYTVKLQLVIIFIIDLSADLVFK